MSTDFGSSWASGQEEVGAKRSAQIAVGGVGRGSQSLPEGRGAHTIEQMVSHRPAMKATRQVFGWRYCIDHISLDGS